ncbi:MAG TPA: MFS transporter [Acidimicrobiia bacterium]|nr:MFS transporter [Acidimicrobiia bacterium]
MRRLFSPAFTLVFLANLFMGMSFFLFVHFPGFLDELGASEVEIGIIFGVTAIASILVRPQIGTAMDRRGRRPVILTGNVLNIGITASYLTISGLGPGIYAIRIVHGLAVAMLFTALTTLAADLVPSDRRTQGLALFGISGLMPIALGGVIGDVVLERSGYDAVFLTATAFAIATGLFSLPVRDARAPAPDDGEGAPSFLAALRRPALRPLWWITLAFSISLTGYFAFLRTFVDETGLGSVGGFFAAYAVTAIILRAVAGWLPDRFGAKTVLYPALAVFATGFVVLASAGSDLAVSVAGALCGAGHAYMFPIIYALIVERSRASELGSAVSIFTGLFDVGTLMGGPTLGVVIGLAGYPTMFLVAGAWVVVGTVAFAVLDGDLPLRRLRSAV